MDKLNLTEKEVRQLFPVTISEKRITAEFLIVDWITMYTELTRLHTAIEGAMEEMNRFIDDIDKIEHPELSNASSSVSMVKALKILNKHLGNDWMTNAKKVLDENKGAWDELGGIK
jgi:hypothetical protein